MIIWRPDVLQTRWGWGRVARSTGAGWPAHTEAAGGVARQQGVWSGSRGCGQAAGGVGISKHNTGPRASLRPTAELPKRWTPPPPTNPQPPLLKSFPTHPNATATSVISVYDALVCFPQESVAYFAMNVFGSDRESLQRESNS